MQKHAYGCACFACRAPEREAIAQRMALEKDVRTQLQDGVAPESIVNALVAKGAEPQDAQLFVARAERLNLERELEDEEESSHNWNLVIGALLVLGGVGATIVSIVMAGPGGGYVLAWSAVLVGLWRIFKGVWSKLG